jgi:hypothetical protein
MQLTSRARVAVALTAVTLGTISVPVGLAVADSGDHQSQVAATGCDVGDPFVRTELFFGLSRPGGRITERQFDRFLDAEVTPRFPDGLTVLSGDGQFRLADGTIIEERSKIVVLLHGDDDVDSKQIDEIRAAYVDAFDQESVLRADAPSCVSF